MAEARQAPGSRPRESGLSGWVLRVLRRLGGPCERDGIVIQVTPITLMVLLLVSSLREQPHHVHCLPLALPLVGAHCR